MSTDLDPDASETAEEDEDIEWGIVDRIRLWRHDAIMQHLYPTAIYWADKIVSFTNDPKDAFWLAQAFFLNQNYARAEDLLTRPFPYAPAATPTILNGISGPSEFGHGKIKSVASVADGFRLPGSPGVRMDEIPVDEPRRLVDASLSCRYLAAQSQIRQGRWQEALETLGPQNPWRESAQSGPNIPNVDGGIKLDSSMSLLRGQLMLKLNREQSAKECFLEALSLDVKNYDAFEQLNSNAMLTVREEWELIQSLSYREHAREEADFVRLMYTIRLKKASKRLKQMAQARRRLAQEFGLIENVDVMFGVADALYAQFRWADCFVITSRIQNYVSFHPPSMPLHIACMHHLDHLHSKLFMLAHELVDKEPEHAISWYAVGVWYLSSKKWADCRKYFSKANILDPFFMPAWIGYAHSYSFEGEHEHAVNSYSTGAKLFRGSHLPFVFIGMEHIALHQLDAAEDAFRAAHQMCDSDPLLLNEMGVVAFNRKDFDKAVTLFESVMTLVQQIQCAKAHWLGTQVNLGSAYRKTGRLQEAKRMYQQVLELEPRHAAALAYLGMIYQMTDELDQAILTYHEALSVDPTNQHVLELLNVALESNIDTPPFARATGAEMWNTMVREQRDARGRLYGVVPAEAATLYNGISVNRKG
ncbi:TPR-like protein [Auriculariales sp. MPI-PUGE-AT-0066]|nr:TPR-like protein [Auriculariales sp. MPI-PUGE-AT-0066]